MIQSFADQTTADLFNGLDTKAARRIDSTVRRAAQRKMKQVDLVTTVEDLRLPPSNHLHMLKGDMAGRYSIRVNMKYRITFRWEGTHAYDVCCEDYHRG